MMLYPLLPRSPEVEAIAAELAQLDVTSCRARRATSHRLAVYLPTGGSDRAGVQHLTEIAEGLTRIAERHGYPGGGRSTSADAEWSEYLHRTLQTSLHQAAQEAMWQFITVVLVPDLVRWRWGVASGTEVSDHWVTVRHRQRNTFGRLWWRCAVLKAPGEADAYRSVHSLGEDELVQLMERTSMSGNRRLSRITADVLLEMSAANPDLNRAELLREQQKRILRLGAFVEFQAAGDAELREVVTKTFVEAARALRGELVPLAAVRAPAARAAREHSLNQRG